MRFALIFIPIICVLCFYFLNQSDRTLKQDINKELIEIDAEIRIASAELQDARDDAGYLGQFFNKNVSEKKEHLKVLKKRQNQLIQEISQKRFGSSFWVGIFLALFSTLAVIGIFAPNIHDTGIRVGGSAVTQESSNILIGLAYLFIGYPLLMWLAWNLIT